LNRFTMIDRATFAPNRHQEFDPGVGRMSRACCQENGAVTKKEIVKQIADRIGETQLKTKDIVQRTFAAIVDTLIEQGRIELRNFGVFAVKQRKARKARNPRTGDPVEVPPKYVVTFKPGKEMEERVREMTHIPDLDDEDSVAGNGASPEHDGAARKAARSTKATHPRKTARQPVANPD
jgi:nucleoid DNA-binding protein